MRLAIGEMRGRRGGTEGCMHRGGGERNALNRSHNHGGNLELSEALRTGGGAGVKEEEGEGRAEGKGGEGIRWRRG